MILNKNEQKNSKKLIALKKFDLINQILKARTSATGETESEIIESLIMEEMLPKEHNMRWWAENYLFPPEGRVAEHPLSSLESTSHLSNTLSAILSNCGSGVLKATEVYKNIKPVITFAKKEEFNCRTILSNQKRIHHFHQQVESFYDLLKIVGDEKESKSNNIRYKALSSDTKLLIEDILKGTKDNATEEERDNINLSAYLAMLISIVEEYWDDTFQYCSRETMDRTFRMLGDICDMSCWEDTPAKRYELLRLMKDVSESWTN